MNPRRVLLLIVFLLAPVLGHAQMRTDLCPLWIGIGPNGSVYELSQRGAAPVRLDMSTLRSRLVTGCSMSRLSSSAVTSVTVKIAPHTLRGTTNTVFNLLAQQGWSRSRVQQQAWSSYPR